MQEHTFTVKVSAPEWRTAAELEEELRDFLEQSFGARVELAKRGSYRLDELVQSIKDAETTARAEQTAVECSAGCDNGWIETAAVQNGEASEMVECSKCAPEPLWVLMVTRKGDLWGVPVTGSMVDLMREADRLDGGALRWQDFSPGNSGAHSTHDDERTYHLYQTRSL